MRVDVVLLSTADWDNPFWTNKQHVAADLARRGFRVLYIDSLGLRRPGLSTRDFRRIGRRLLRGLRPPRKARPNVWVWSPFVLPFHGNSRVRWFNRRLLSAGLWVWMKRLRFSETMLWSYNPLSCQLLDLSVFSRVVYHCVDEMKAMPGLPATSLERAETAFVERAEFVFVTSKKLEESRIKLNANTFYFPNVADYEHFSKAMNAELDIPEDLATIPGPRIGFIGAISSYKIDFKLLKFVAEEHPDWSLVLIGNVGEGDPSTDASMLGSLRNVHLLGPRDYAELPAYLKGMDVAILPNNLNEYTAAMFPMKFFEYLAAGKPVVSVDLHALQEYGEIACLAKTAADFVAGIARAVAGQIVPLERRLAAARLNTYSGRMDRMLRVIKLD
jgi:glycosyltransferase involved in cell wall biosynthesis